MPARSNQRLDPLPDDDTFLRAVWAAENDGRWEHRFAGYGAPATGLLAHLPAIQGARRLGRGAVKGSWSGTMSSTVRITPRLRSLSIRGLVYRSYPPGEYRTYYMLTRAGRERIGVTR